MICSKCGREVFVLWNTEEQQDVCILCVQEYNLNPIPYKISEEKVKKVERDKTFFYDINKLPINRDKN